jgi:glyoxylase-like metal-dependent hydrolase (beta-lactamase superfamily II)/ferredoxin
MANYDKRVPENVGGEFLVDTTCIDCDTCRQLAPRTFGEAADTAFVHAQPTGTKERREALRALVCCPTGSIGLLDSAASDDGAIKESGPKSVFADFPLLLEDSVYYCGFNSPKSYGGNSYFIRRPDGNWLVDAPKFLPQLAKRFEALGGIANIFLTHRDDVADAAQYAERFGARRIIHRLELASQPDAEVVLDGFTAQQLAPGLLAIPTPGHTAGHLALLVDDKYLFTGDHLDFDRDTQQLAASRDYCWHSWPEQTKSIERLAEYRFEWVLPGHGQRVRLPAEEMRRQVLALAEWMLAVS